METTTRSIRILVCDDHEIFAETLTFALNAETGLEVCATVTNLDQAKMMFDVRPDVAVVDVRLGGENGLDLVAWITENHPECRTIVLTAYDSDENLVRASESGAHAFMVKSTSIDHLVSIIRDLMNGYAMFLDEYVDAARSRIANQRSTDFATLTAADQRLIGLIAQGLPDRQIAAEMHLSLQTVRNKVSRILHQLGLANRTRLAVWWQDQNRTSSDA